MERERRASEQGETQLAIVSKALRKIRERKEGKRSKIFTFQTERCRHHKRFFKKCFKRVRCAPEVVEIAIPPSQKLKIKFTI